MDLAQVLSNAGPTLLLAMALLALVSGKLIFPRELDVAEKRIDELTKEKDEWKQMALRSVDVTARATELVRDGERR